MVISKRGVFFIVLLLSITLLSFSVSADFFCDAFNWDCPEAPPGGARPNYLPCNSNDDCEVGNLCQRNFCVPRSEVDTCDYDEDCIGAGICINGFCQDPSQAGCRVDIECDTGELCIDGTCQAEPVPEAPPGEVPCILDSQCPFGQACAGEFCVDALGKGASGCSFLRCGNGLVCDEATDTCKFKSCRNELECTQVAPNCNQGLCTPQPNQPPLVEIISPQDGSSFEVGEQITFDVRVTDPEGSPVARYKWDTGYVDWDTGYREIRTDKSFTFSYDRADDYVITAEASDGQFMAEDSVRITIGGAEIECASDAHCGVGKICVNGVCIEAEGHIGACPRVNRITGGTKQCGCASDNACESNAMPFTCSSLISPIECVRGTTCKLDENGVPGCYALEQIQTCFTDVDCPDGKTCEFRICTGPADLGESCLVSRCGPGLVCTGNICLREEDFVRITPPGQEEVDELTIIETFCENYPDNFLCLGLGISDLIDLCQMRERSEICENLVPHFGPSMSEIINSCRENRQLCEGREDIIPYCLNLERQVDPVCPIIYVVIPSCIEEGICFELSDVEKERLCRLENYSFCEGVTIDPRSFELGDSLTCNYRGDVEDLLFEWYKDDNNEEVLERDLPAGIKTHQLSANALSSWIGDEDIEFVKCQVYDSEGNLLGEAESTFGFEEPAFVLQPGLQELGFVFFCENPLFDCAEGYVCRTVNSVDGCYPEEVPPANISRQVFEGGLPQKCVNGRLKAALMTRFGDHDNDGIVDDPDCDRCIGSTGGRSINRFGCVEGAQSENNPRTSRSTTTCEDFNGIYCGSLQCAPDTIQWAVPSINAGDVRDPLRDGGVCCVPVDNRILVGEQRALCASSQFNPSLGTLESVTESDCVDPDGDGYGTKTITAGASSRQEACTTIPRKTRVSSSVPFYSIPQALLTLMILTAFYVSRRKRNL